MILMIDEMKMMMVMMIIDELMGRCGGWIFTRCYWWY